MPLAQAVRGTPFHGARCKGPAVQVKNKPDKTKAGRLCRTPLASPRMSTLPAPPGALPRSTDARALLVIVFAVALAVIQYIDRVCISQAMRRSRRT